MVDRAKKISELTVANSIVTSDLIVVVSNTTGTSVTKSANIATLATTLGQSLILNALARTSNNGIVYTLSGLTYSSNNFSYSGNTVHLANNNYISLNGVRVFSGAATTRIELVTHVGSVGLPGSLYLSTAGKMYLKVANTGVATDDWQRVTTTAVD